MTLTIQQIYERYSQREFKRVIEIKRRNEDGLTYESNWQNVEELSGLKLLDKSVQNISYKLPNNNYNFGIVNVGNAQVSLNSKNGQFDDERNSGSIFNGFIRHKSLIRIREGYVDKYTDSSNSTDVLINVFQGFIDDTSNSTKVDNDNLIQTLQCIDMLSFLLKDNTISDIGTLTSTTLESLIYEILNRSQFTNFFTVNASNINAGYDINPFDVSQYEEQTTLYSLFENFSAGHSFFYVKDEIFYYQDITSTNTSSLSIDDKKIIEFASYGNGINNIFEVLYWEDSTESFVASPNNYNRSKTINVKGVTNTTQRQNLLNTIGGVTKQQRSRFKLKMPYFPDVFILDEITVQSPEIIPSDAFVWGVSKWGEARWRLPLKADNISSTDSWLVREVKHSNLVTTLILEEVII
jgi:hypothetical protein